MTIWKVDTMTTRYGEDKKRYELMINQAIKYFTKAEWYDKSYPIESPNGKPDPIGSHIPEIWAKKDDKVIIMAVETCKSIDTEDAKFRFREFSRAKGVSFHVATPKDCKFKAQEMAEKWNTPLEKIWTFSKY